MKKLILIQLITQRSIQSKMASNQKVCSSHVSPALFNQITKMMFKRLPIFLSSRSLTRLSSIQYHQKLMGQSCYTTYIHKIWKFFKKHKVRRRNLWSWTKNSIQRMKSRRKTRGLSKERPKLILISTIRSAET